MALGESNKVIWVNIGYASFIYGSVGDLAGADQLTEPGGGLGIVFVVVVHSCILLSCISFVTVCRFNFPDLVADSMAR